MDDMNFKVGDYIIIDSPTSASEDARGMVGRIESIDDTRYYRYLIKFFGGRRPEYEVYGEEEFRLISEDDAMTLLI